MRKLQRAAMLAATAVAILAFANVTPARTVSGTTNAATLVDTGPPNSYYDEHEPARLALVVHNVGYANADSLPGSSEDAKRMTASLREAGFAVTEVNALTNARDFGNQIKAFSTRIDTGDIVVIYFSGHGFSFNSKNWLVPSDFPSHISAGKVDSAAVAIESIAKLLTGNALAGYVAIVLDACRSPARFIVEDTAHQNVLDAVVAEDRFVNPAVHTLYAYAVGPKQPAIGFDGAQPSPYTESLAHWIGAKDSVVDETFDDLLKAVARQVARKTGKIPNVLPDPFGTVILYPSALTVKSRQEEWRSAVGDSANPETAMDYLMHYPATRQTRAARRWLRTHPSRQYADAYTRMSPLTIDAAWDPSVVHQTVWPSNYGLAFSRSVDLTASPELAALDRTDLGVRQAGNDRYLSRAKLASAVRVMSAHDNIVATRPFLAYVAPSTSSRAARRVDSSTKIQVLNFVDRGTGGTWVETLVPGSADTVFLRLIQEASLPLELGRSLREIVVGNRAGGVSALVAPQPIAAAVRAIHSRGDSISWVSLSSGVPSNERMRTQLALEVANAKLLLERLGIPRRSMTSVSSLAEVPGDSVRIRFFGW